jgi:hypothetical protein
MSSWANADTSRQHPWSTYTVFLTTLTQWALIWDIGLLYFCPKEVEIFGPVVALMFISKWIKFVGHYIRHPVDILFLPVSILFGYFHSCFIKTYAACTLHVVSFLAAIFRWLSSFMVL